MRRRTFVAGTVALLDAPLAAEAPQAPRVHRAGHVFGAAASEASSRGENLAPYRRVTLLAVLLSLTVLGLPEVAVAWPAIQDLTGVHLCTNRPVQKPDGQWTCRSDGVLYEGTLVEVSQGLGGPPGGRPPSGPYGGPWGPPSRGPSGYDALEPWLRSPSDR